MKQSIIEVLVYLLETSAQCVVGEHANTVSEKQHVVKHLESVGFSEEVISRSFVWLRSLIEQQCWYVTTKTDKSEPKTIRIFDHEEQLRLNLATRKFILSLEYAGILDTKMREIVICRLLQLNHWHIDIVDAKWVVLLVVLSKFDRNITEICNYLLAAMGHEEEI